MRKLLSALFALLILMPSLSMASSDVLIWGRGGDSVMLDLAQATDGESIKAGIQVLENLVKFGDNSMDVEPQLAESWKVSDDHKPGLPICLCVLCCITYLAEKVEGQKP